MFLWLVADEAVKVAIKIRSSKSNNKIMEAIQVAPLNIQIGKVTHSVLNSILLVAVAVG